MAYKALPTTIAVVVLLAATWCAAEPWLVTFFDDGPYYSTGYPEATDDLPVLSTVDLRRFGAVVYTLESRVVSGLDASVLVLRDVNGQPIWTRLPDKPDGKLGAIELRQPELVWSGGWRIRIVPAYQERGDLYIGAFGRFRFFNHSW